MDTAVDLGGYARRMGRTKLGVRIKELRATLGELWSGVRGSRPDEDERAKVVEARLKALRSGLGLDEPDYLLLPDDPICIALKVPNRWSTEKRRGAVRQKIVELIDGLEDERRREALRVAYRLHPDYQEHGSTERSKKYAVTAHLSYRTVQRDENKVISELALIIAKGPRPVLPGRKFRIAPSGEPIPVWAIRLLKLFVAFGIFVVIVYLAARLQLHFP